MPGPIRDPRADELLQRYRAAFGGDELPVPVEAIAEDLLGLAVEERDLEGVSGLLYPAVRQVYLEREANVFAAELLMAEEKLRRALTGSAGECAEHFGVSELAMRWRLYSFGLLPSRPDETREVSRCRWRHIVRS